MVTITRLYKDHETAERVVAELERSGVPQDNNSIISNNDTGWFGRRGSTSTTIDRDADGVDDRTEGAAAGAGIRVRSEGWPVSLPVSASWQFRESGRSLQRGGSPRLPLWPSRAAPPAV